MHAPSQYEKNILFSQKVVTIHYIKGTLFFSQYMGYNLNFFSSIFMSFGVVLELKPREVLFKIV